MIVERVDKRICQLNKGKRFGLLDVEVYCQAVDTLLFAGLCIDKIMPA